MIVFKISIRNLYIYILIKVLWSHHRLTAHRKTLRRIFSKQMRSLLTWQNWGSCLVWHHKVLLLELWRSYHSGLHLLCLIRILHALKFNLNLYLYLLSSLVLLSVANTASVARVRILEEVFIL